MARFSYQKGSIDLRTRKHGKVYVLRYRLRQSDRWVEKTEELSGCKTEKEAQKAADKRMKDINELNNGASAMTLNAFIEGPWKSYVENQGWKPSTTYIYGTMIKRFVVPLLGKKQLDQINACDITTFFDQVRQLGTGRRMVSNLYGFVKMLFGVAVDSDLIKGNSPVKRKLHRPKYEKAEKPTLSPEEVNRVICSVDPEHRPLIVAAAVIALRIGELLALRWRDVDLERRVLTVSHNLWRGHLGTPKTRTSRKTLRVSELLAEVLSTHRQRTRWKGLDDWVFAREDGSAWNQDTLRQKVLYPAMDLAGIKRVKGAHGFHCFRHSAGSIVHALTGDLKLAQELLRHSNIKTTADVYVHVGEAAAGEVSELLSRRILENGGLPVAQSSDLVQ